MGVCEKFSGDAQKYQGEMLYFDGGEALPSAILALKQYILILCIKVTLLVSTG